MDLREKKTKRSIKNAFIQLRATTPLERISVKALAELAEINKATFYLHYKDIYDLSNALQQEVIQNILNIVPSELFFKDTRQFTHVLFQAFYSEETLINILFSGSQATALPTSIERELKKCIFNTIPEAKDNAKFNILLSFSIQGVFYSYMENYKQFGYEETIQILSEISALNELTTMY